MRDPLLPRALAAIALLCLLSLPLGSGYAGSLVTWIAIAAVMASSLRFVLLIGELNFAVAAFFGLGAYAAGVATTMAQWPFAVSLVCGAVVALVASALFGWVTLRVKGPYFLLIGFAFTEVLRILYARSAWLGGNSGLVGIFPPEALERHFPTLVLGLCGVLILALTLVERSQVGRVFTAIRDNESVVRSVGIPVHALKVACLCMASAATGVAGALHAFANNVISPPDFGILLATFALAYLKVGGEQHPLGPVAGAVLLVLLASWAQGFGSGDHIVYGAAIVVAVLFMPTGLVGLLQRARARVAARQVLVAREGATDGR